MNPIDALQRWSAAGFPTSRAAEDTPPRSARRLAVPHVGEQPGPAFARRRRVVLVAEHLELVAARGRRLVRGRVRRRCGHDETPARGVARRPLEVPEERASR